MRDQRKIDKKSTKKRSIVCAWRSLKREREREREREKERKQSVPKRKMKKLNRMTDHRSRINVRPIPISYS